MPFGNYAKKSVQSMEGLFGVLGGLGNKSSSVTRDEILKLGRRRSMIAGGALGAGSAIIGNRRSSGRNGLAPRGSAPPPGQLPYGY